MRTLSDAENDDMPAASVELAVLGAILLELESRRPGFTRACFDRIQRENHVSSVVRLRGPKRAAETMKALDGASAWLATVSAFAEAAYGPPYVPKKRGKRA